MESADYPSLHAVQSFAAAAKYLSFSGAAKHLFVSPGAVSRMVRQLERETGVELFTRKGRSLELTPQGEVYFVEVAGGLERIAAATRILRGRDGGNILSIAVLPTFALRCLVPRLHDFQTQHPDIFVDMITRDGQTGVIADNIDVSICIGTGDWHNAEATLICHEQVAIYGSAAYKERGITTLADLLQQRLIIHSTRPEAWHIFFSAFGLPAPDMRESPRFEHNFMVVEAAVAGLGIALLPTFSAEGEVAAGRLVQLLPQTLQSRDAYYLVHKIGASSHRKIRLFTNWLSKSFSTQE